LLGFSDQPHSIYPAIDLLAVPSVNEGLSNVILEAMACGVPVLSHQACGSVEAITGGSDGVVADLGSAAALAAELANLLHRSDTLAAMGARARQTAVSRFSLSQMADQYAELYRQLSIP
jgi:glycosyltransferase involved in cell wall biosynthesis